MNYTVLRLAVALGFRDLTPLSEGQVRAILRRWVALRDGGARDGALGMPPGGPTREPGWLLWCATVDAKLGSLPRHTTRALLAWECSGPECEALVSELLEDEVADLWADKARAARCGQRRFGEDRDAQIRAVRQALGELARSRPYAVAMERLRWTLAEAMSDQEFSGVLDRLQRRELT